MKLTILAGSPRKNGNTNSLLKAFIEEAEKLGAEYERFDAYEMDVHGCIACRGCQKDWEHYSCVFDDDFHPVYDSVMSSDAIVVATPIYGWFCPGPLKNILDRLIYNSCMFYGEEKGPALFKGKKLYILCTCGYGPEKGAYVFEEGMKMYCKHLKMEYGGMLCERDLGYDKVFMDNEKALHAALFAGKIINS